jgi:hypothetical protein
VTLTLPDSGAPIEADGRRSPAAAARNAGPILEILRAHAPASGLMLEVAAGSGLHSAAFASALPGLDWHPTDVDLANFTSITAWSATTAKPPHPPVHLDATQAGWSTQWPTCDAILVVNLLHLISTPACTTLLAETALALAPAGTAFLYGPFLRDGHPTSLCDVTFDASLRAQDPTIGYKDLAWVQDRLDASGLTSQCLAMPANNLMILARHR